MLELRPTTGLHEIVKARLVTQRITHDDPELMPESTYELVALELQLDEYPVRLRYAIGFPDYYEILSNGKRLRGLTPETERNIIPTPMWSFMKHLQSCKVPDMLFDYLVDDISLLEGMWAFWDGLVVESKVDYSPFCEAWSAKLMLPVIVTAWPKEWRTRLLITDYTGGEH